MKWVVTIQAYNRQTVTRIEADSKEEAIEKAQEKIGYKAKAQPSVNQ